MTRHITWTRTGLTALLAVWLFGAPDIASAKDRCDNKKYRNGRAFSNRYYDGGNYRSVGDRGYSRYRDSEYRYRDNDYRYSDRNYRAPRSTGDSAVIVAGSAGAGAALGGLLGGGKGALLGAAVGGAGGLVYDRVTRNGSRRR